MPRSRSLRTIISEVVIYVGLFAIVGHLCQNLCERFMLQSELRTMKSELTSLEIMIHNIGMAYDNLRDDIKAVLNTEPRKWPLCMKCLKKRVEEVTELTEFKSKAKDFMQNFRKSTNDFVQNWNTPVKDDSTFTERLLNCFSFGGDSNNSGNCEISEEKEFCECVAKCAYEHSKHRHFDTSLRTLHCQNGSLEKSSTSSKTTSANIWKVAQFTD